VLEQSGIRIIVEPRLGQITKKVKAKKPENAYQVQEMLLDIVQKLKSDTELRNGIEQAAYNSGVSVETVLLVAAIDIRDTVLERLNMKPDDIDRHKPGTK
jgi:prophage DNA circulation protein